MKIICVTGGVLSGIGKWITGASVGAILKSAGYQIFMQKFDGYLNVDPGLMSPLEHGEVFITDDGTEADVDIGHYERYIDTNLNRHSSWTTGKIYQEIFEREKNGEYHGRNVQVISHVAPLVKEKIKDWFQQNAADISLVEIGGTVGDMENEYLIEAVRQLKHELGAHNVVFIHLVYLPFLWASQELKTRPAQFSVKDLRSRGVEPDILIVRSDQVIEQEMLRKLSLMTGVEESCIIPSTTVKSIYQVPVNYQNHALGNILLQKLNLSQRPFDMSKRNTLMQHIQQSTEVKKVAIVGEYCALEDSYYSLNEGLKAAGYRNTVQIQFSFISTKEIEEADGVARLQGVDGIVVPWGSGEVRIEGLVLAAQYARERQIPYLGIGLGAQVMAIEFARNVLGYPEANSEEFFPEGQYSVLRAGEMRRLGSYPCKLDPESLAFRLYGSEEIAERHRNRYEFNPAFRELFEQHGLHISGTSLDGELVEVIELREHPFMIATQGHPEFKSRPLVPHPLFMGFVGAMKDSRR